MSYRGLEDAHLTYYKLLDGMNIKQGGKVCDSSFNDFVTAKYLAEKNLFDKVYAMTVDKMIVQDKIEPMRCGPMIAQTMRRVRVDAHMCLGGTFNYIPVHDVTHALHSSLNAGGSIYIAVYPNVYDSQGRDVLMMLSELAQLPVKDKLTRWSVTVTNSITNMFTRIENEEVIADSSIGEIISLLSAEHYKQQLFRSNVEYEKFFQPLSADQKYYMSWNVLKGMRL
ncbi:hypothetical protein Dacet_1198 [Denitrovibrio acetiphilus DSM 12809]|uniref:Methyltransferase type 11 n=1 Tax=Denitrovibrio acetiphilus (strain DSM 12809 / NBRC 114555 / N2460) TaxID=522772 RepID=D4H7H1_DENA2|nr:hypothetical protein [Denitrovibrio acetiphilus]ADD67970.1 hypothetical protein Dacet_1198 [Denitrovibrio acetiphilus DSM 12809]